MQSESLKNKVAVVTGAASGIGKGISGRIARAGAHVVVADIEDAAAAEAAREIGGVAMHCDVSDCASMRSLADAVMARFGRVDLLFNNAGVGPIGPISDLTVDDWRWVIDVNLFGVIHGVHVFLPLLEGNPDGAWIINTASVGGMEAFNGLAAYCASKFAVVALTESLAAELKAKGSNVRTAVLCPGTVSTKIVDSGRNRPKSHRVGFKRVDLRDSHEFADQRWMDPDEVGEVVIGAIQREDFYIFTHPEMMTGAGTRFDTIMKAVAAAGRRHLVP